MKGTSKGTKRKAQGDASTAAAAAGSGDAFYLILCSRSSCVEQFDENFTMDHYEDELEEDKREVSHEAPQIRASSASRRP
ncbi:hypothetical protein OEZ86_007408 [Tetradesmus obliquus]|nr:hypothetical protein OEZ86_007408 [Tetradesmus obliquus]